MTNSQLFKIVITPNFVVYNTSEWNGRESDELHDYVRGEKTVQDGWKITFSELAFDFSREETAFATAYSIMEAAKKDAGYYDLSIGVNYPNDVRKEIIGNLTPVVSKKTVILPEEDAQFELIPEEFYAFTRVGMSTVTTFARKCVLSAPIKENRSGLSVRGYACSLCSYELVDLEFCEYIFNLKS